MSPSIDPPRLSRTTWERPVFALTADQDWAPAWASEQLLAAAATLGMPLHVFRTNPCPVLDDAFARGRITQGWHPNFLPGSDHGDTPEEVIAYCRAHFPGCRTARAHCFMEHTMAWDALAAAGIVADSQVPTYFQEGLVPLLHASGIWRLPVYFEDDIFFRSFPLELRLDRIRGDALRPRSQGAQLPPHVRRRERPVARLLRRDQEPLVLDRRRSPEAGPPGRGTRAVLEELAALVTSRGFAFESFEALVDRLPGVG